MDKIDKLEIDYKEREGKRFYRFYIEWNLEGKIESCYCYQSFKEAFDRANYIIDKH